MVQSLDTGLTGHADFIEPQKDIRKKADVIRFLRNYCLKTKNAAYIALDCRGKICGVTNATTRCSCRRLFWKQVQKIMTLEEFKNMIKLDVFGTSTYFEAMDKNSVMDQMVQYYKNCGVLDENLDK